jgi:aminocarboxymuconate-semialdehyde decarboxylase
MSAPTVVDVHAHAIVPELLRERAPDERWRPRLRWEAGRHVAEVEGVEVRSAVAEWSDPAVILERLARAGIDHVLLAPWILTVGYDLDAAECLRRSRVQNRGLAAMARAHPGHISALGTVPLQEPALAADELRALMSDGALCGVEIAASVDSVLLGDDRFAPFWAAAAETGALVFIHPTTRGFGGASFADHYLWNAVGNPLETTASAAHLVLSGVLERHPDLRILLAHGGGALATLRGRLRHAWLTVPATRERLGHEPDVSLRRFHYDSVVHDPALLRELIDWVGADHVLLGTDHPFDMGDHFPLETIRGAGLAAEQERALLGGNAERLLSLERP